MWEYFKSFTKQNNHPLLPPTCKWRNVQEHIIYINTFTIQYRGPPLILCRALCKRLSERSVGLWVTHATDTLFPNNYTIQSLPDSLVPLLLCTKEEEFISVIVMLRTLSIVRISRCYRPPVCLLCTVTKPALFHNVVLNCTPQNHIYRNEDMWSRLHSYTTLWILFFVDMCQK